MGGQIITVRERLMATMKQGRGVNSMAERTITTKLELVGADDYVAGVERVTAALKAASEAKKEFDALFTKVPNSSDAD